MSCLSGEVDYSLLSLYTHTGVQNCSCFPAHTYHNALAPPVVHLHFCKSIYSCDVRKSNCFVFRDSYGSLYLLAHFQHSQVPLPSVRMLEGTISRVQEQREGHRSELENQLSFNHSTLVTEHLTSTCQKSRIHKVANSSAKHPQFRLRLIANAHSSFPALLLGQHQEQGREEKCL